MESQLGYLKSVIEGVPGVEPWGAWFARNDAELQKGLTRGEYLRLKLTRTDAIVAILAARGVTYVASDRYAYLGGVEGRCRDCGAVLEYYGGAGGGAVWCTKGCYEMTWS